MDKCLRPHHGMCFQFYEGKGYSKDFTDHMGRVIKEMENAPEQKITLTVSTDLVCSNCPNNEENKCNSFGQVKRYDEGVLQACGLEDGESISYENFIKVVKEKVIDTGVRKKICGDCGWNYICSKKEAN
ncbi:MAG: DUF1284 domain-containing protein [Pseudobutyrivibrio sp.]|nr:DUF1284 domain-containing protein [Pseudobutyrivibrio sp.]